MAIRGSNSTTELIYIHVLLNCCEVMFYRSKSAMWLERASRY